MMTDIILSLVILFLLVERYLTQKGFQQERKEWTKGMLAKDLRELTDNEVMEKTKEPEPYKPPDSVSMDDAVDDEVLFDRHIAAVKAQAKEELKKEMEV